MKSTLFSITTILLTLFHGAAAFAFVQNGVIICTSSSGSALLSTAEGATESNQGKYGKELALPDTYVRCGRCATSFALTDSDLGEGKGSRVQCSVCGHNWFQSRDRLFNLNEGRELVPMPEVELDRISSNIAKGRDPDYIGDTKFFVGNLDFAVEDNDIREMFAAKGEVGDVSLVRGPDGRSKGFAFVTMMDPEVLDECLKLDGYELKGRAINVKEPL